TFEYVTSSPINYIDPSGRDRWGIPEDPWYPGSKKPPFHVRPDGNPWGWGCGSEENDHIIPDIVWGINLTPACRAHDLCYESVCESGVTQETCDLKFHRDIYDLCIAAGHSDGRCAILAGSYYEGVHKGGHTSFNKEKQKCRGGCK